MKPFALALLITILAGCSTSKDDGAWRVREMALGPTSAVTFYGPGEKVLLSVKRQTIQKLLLAHFRITRSAGIQAELFIVEGDYPNAFAGYVNGQRMIAINIAMIKLIGEDTDEYAALLGHESAHWAKGHVDASKSRASTIHVIGTLVGAGLGMAGVPAASVITGLSADLIEASYSRDDEREADGLSIDYMLANGFDPQGAVRLQEKMLKLPGTLKVPFLSTHPSGQERVENLKKVIATEQGKNGVVE
ncbi:MAG TPA: M48 family metalloprotease [Candidatus Binatia bacterium]|nr:M48 family metalloprotease [Candidatus Binatia bacterium]